MSMSHVTIMVKDLEKSMEFYEKCVGLKVVRDLRVQNAETPIVFMAADKTDTAVELVANQAYTYSGGGISFGFQVGDAEAERTKKQSEGYDPGPMMSPNPFVKFFFVKDPDGVAVQFIEEH